jgi:hypothetical protein
VMKAIPANTGATARAKGERKRKPAISPLWSFRD